MKKPITELLEDILFVGCLFVCLLALGFLYGCTPVSNPSEWVKFNDMIWQKQYSPECGLVLGARGIYVVYGTKTTKTFKIPAGVCYLAIPEPKSAKFRILDILKTYPELDDPLARKASAIQELQIRKLPEALRVKISGQ